MKFTEIKAKCTQKYAGRIHSILARSDGYKDDDVVLNYDYDNGELTLVVFRPAFEKGEVCRAIGLIVNETNAIITYGDDGNEDWA